MTTHLTTRAIPFDRVRLIDPLVYPHHADAIPPGVMEAGQYELRFAWTRADLHAVQALRYAVFVEELGEGHGDATVMGRDDDGRDLWFHHLMIVERATGAIVGTYRVQTAVMAATRFGFYSATLFELGAMPSQILDAAVEAGRACVAPAHRTGRVLRLLWRGLARYLLWNSKRYIFGCCSLPGTEQGGAVAAWRAISARAMVHDRILVRPRGYARALPDDGRQRVALESDAAQTTLPALLEGYLTLGARVCGPPAFDRKFQTTELLVLLDVEALEPTVFRSLFG